MKVSVSLPDEDLTFLDEYAQRSGYPSRSSVLHRAIGLLRLAELEEEYRAAADEWEQGAEAQLWENTISDGIADAPR